MVEVLPGLQVYAARRGADGSLADVVVAQGDAVLAARRARVRVSGDALVVEAEKGTLRRGALEARFDELVLPVDLREEVAVRRSAIGTPSVGARTTSFVTFALVALASVLGGLLLAARPASLALLAAALVAGRELAARAGVPGALLVVAMALPLAALALFATRRDAFE
jgi:hypothetical protein